LEKEKS
jgi:hypothetical protein